VVDDLRHGATPDELGYIIGESERGGHLTAGLSDLLERALSFGERTAAEVMVPRPDVVSVPAGARPGDLVALVTRTGHTDYPVTGTGVDDVVGVVGVRELAGAVADGTGEVSARGLSRPALLVPDSLALPALITQMQAAGEEFACVVDEYGGLAGILTFEDIAEELVGEIADENDADSEPAAAGPDGSWRLDAGRRVDAAAQLTGLALPTSNNYDTLAGLVMSQLGRLPQPGDVIVLGLLPTTGGPAAAEIEVLSVGRRVAESVLLRPARTDFAVGAGAGAAHGATGSEPVEGNAWTR
jgi:CBS domain containing-hemolysin-like protein